MELFIVIVGMPQELKDIERIKWKLDSFLVDI